MIRFSSVAVSFAASTIVLAAGEGLTAGQLAVLLTQHAGKGEHAVTSTDRPTLVAATKAFRAALTTGVAPTAEPTTVASPSVPFARTTLVPLAVALEASDAHRTEVMAKGSTASPEAKAAVKAAVEAVPVRTVTIPLRQVGPDRPLILTEATPALVVQQATITTLTQELAKAQAALAALQEENAFLEGRIQDLEAQLPSA